MGLVVELTFWRQKQSFGLRKAWSSSRDELEKKKQWRQNRRNFSTCMAVFFFVACLRSHGVGQGVSATTKWRQKRRIFFNLFGGVFFAVCLGGHEVGQRVSTTTKWRQNVGIFQPFWRCIFRCMPTRPYVGQRVSTATRWRQKRRNFQPF